MINLTQPPPSYLPAVFALGATLPPGLAEVYVIHDEDCKRPNGGNCTCKPTITRGFTLWFRTGRRAKWEAVATMPTEAEAWGAIPGTNRKGGDWCVLAAGKKP